MNGGFETLRNLQELLRFLSPKRKLQLVMVLALMLAASLAEVVSIGAVVPFLGALMDPESLFLNPVLQNLWDFFSVSDTTELILLITLLFISAAIVSACLRLALLWYQTKLSHQIGADLSVELYRRCLNRQYSEFIKSSSSELIASIATKTTSIANQIVLRSLVVVSSSLVLISIFCILFYLNPLVSIAAVVVIGSSYLGIAYSTKNALFEYGLEINDKQDQVVKTVQEGLGGIRDILIDGTQRTFIRIFKDADVPLRQAQAKIQIISQSPKFVVEAVGITLIAAAAYYLSLQPSGISGAIPTLGAFALGAQRILPAIQQVYAGWSLIKGHEKILIETLDQLNREEFDGGIEGAELPKFSEELVLEGVSFRYSNTSPWVLLDVDMNIPKGSRVGIIGQTGSGKSTLLDLLMGLLEPTSGSIRLDGTKITRHQSRALQKQIAHVPQSVFLADTSVMQNIAFGKDVEDINQADVIRSSEMAQISEDIQSWGEGFSAAVGENGVRLSGGQKQRIGIARALYKDAEILILDEATNAIDRETEEAILESIVSFGSNRTIIVVAHNESSLRMCNKLYEVRDSRVAEVSDRKLEVSRLKV